MKALFAAFVIAKQARTSMCASGRQGTHLDTQALRHAVYVASFWTESGSPCAALQPPHITKTGMTFKVMPVFPLCRDCPFQSVVFQKAHPGGLHSPLSLVFRFRRPAGMLLFRKGGNYRAASRLTAILIRRRVSCLPSAAASSMPPPGVNCLPETATRSGQSMMPFLQPSDSMSAKRAV